MSATLKRVLILAKGGQVRISDHGYDELRNDVIFVEDVLLGVPDATVVEDYPSAAKGPSVLVLQKDGEGRPLHVIWGIPKGRDGPAVLVTAYRPDLARWSDDFMRRQ